MINVSRATTNITSSFEQLYISKVNTPITVNYLNDSLRQFVDYDLTKDEFGTTGNIILLQQQQQPYNKKTYNFEYTTGYMKLEKVQNYGTSTNGNIFLPFIAERTNKFIYSNKTLNNLGIGYTIVNNDDSNLLYVEMNILIQPVSAYYTVELTDPINNTSVNINSIYNFYKFMAGNYKLNVKLSPLNAVNIKSVSIKFNFFKKNRDNQYIISERKYLPDIVDFKLVDFVRFNTLLTFTQPIANTNFFLQNSDSDQILIDNYSLYTLNNKLYNIKYISKLLLNNVYKNAKQIVLNNKNFKDPLIIEYYIEKLCTLYTEFIANGIDPLIIYILLNYGFVYNLYEKVANFEGGYIEDEELIMFNFVNIYKNKFSPYLLNIEEIYNFLNKETQQQQQQEQKDTYLMLTFFTCLHLYNADPLLFNNSEEKFWSLKLRKKLSTFLKNYSLDAYLFNLNILDYTFERLLFMLISVYKRSELYALYSINILKKYLNFENILHQTSPSPSSSSYGKNQILTITNDMIEVHQEKEEFIFYFLCDNLLYVFNDKIYIFYSINLINQRVIDSQILNIYIDGKIGGVVDGLSEFTDYKNKLSIQVIFYKYDRVKKVSSIEKIDKYTFDDLYTKSYLVLEKNKVLNTDYNLIDYYIVVRVKDDTKLLSHYKTFLNNYVVADNSSPTLNFIKPDDKNIKDIIVPTWLERHNYIMGKNVVQNRQSTYNLINKIVQEPSILIASNFYLYTNLQQLNDLLPIIAIQNFAENKFTTNPQTKEYSFEQVFYMSRSSVEYVYVTYTSNTNKLPLLKNFSSIIPMSLDTSFGDLNRSENIRLVDVNVIELTIVNTSGVFIEIDLSGLNLGRNTTDIKIKFFIAENTSSSPNYKLVLSRSYIDIDSDTLKNSEPFILSPGKYLIKGEYEAPLILQTNLRLIEMLEVHINDISISVREYYTQPSYDLYKINFDYLNTITENNFIMTQQSNIDTAFFTKTNKGFRVNKTTNVLHKTQMDITAFLLTDPLVSKYKNLWNSLGFYLVYPKITENFGDNGDVIRNVSTNKYENFVLYLVQDFINIWPPAQIGFRNKDYGYYIKLKQTLACTIQVSITLERNFVYNYFNYYQTGNNRTAPMVKMETSIFDINASLFRSVNIGEIRIDYDDVNRKENRFFKLETKFNFTFNANTEYMLSSIGGIEINVDQKDLITLCFVSVKLTFDKPLALLNNSTQLLNSVNNQRVRQNYLPITTSTTPPPPPPSIDFVEKFDIDYAKNFNLFIRYPIINENKLYWGKIFVYKPFDYDILNLRYKSLYDILKDNESYYYKFFVNDPLYVQIDVAFTFELNNKPNVSYVFNTYLNETVINTANIDNSNKTVTFSYRVRLETGAYKMFSLNTTTNVNYRQLSSKITFNKLNIEDASNVDLVYNNYKMIYTDEDRALINFGDYANLSALNFFYDKFYEFDNSVSTSLPNKKFLEFYYKKKYAAGSNLEILNRKKLFANDIFYSYATKNINVSLNNNTPPFAYINFYTKKMKMVITTNTIKNSSFVKINDTVYDMNLVGEILLINIAFDLTFMPIDSAQKSFEKTKFEYNANIMNRGKFNNTKELFNYFTNSEIYNDKNFTNWINNFVQKNPNINLKNITDATVFNVPFKSVEDYKEILLDVVLVNNEYEIIESRYDLIIDKYKLLATNDTLNFNYIEKFLVKNSSEVFFINCSFYLKFSDKTNIGQRFLLNSIKIFV